MFFRAAWFILAVLIFEPVWAQEHQAIRIGLLKFGTVSWEIDTVRHHGLDRKHGIAVTPVEFASNEAAKVALQAGAVDLIVTDWPWVARQRGEGAAFSFIPYSKAVGVLMLPSGSRIGTPADLKGKRIGVVGGPLDKSWLLLQAYMQRKFGIAFADASEPVFGAPPLLNQELAQGRIDAVLTYWHYAARLEAEGAKPLLGVSDMIRELGVTHDVPMLGYAFQEDWGVRNGRLLDSFAAASREAKSLLAASKDEWTRLTPQIGTDDPAALTALQMGFRAGIPERWAEAERRAAMDLYAILVDIGGEKLVGRATSVDPKTFWPLTY
jgi:NitT/TauT family transport system substrate-binding protein